MSVQQLLVRALREVVDGSLGNAILKMCVNTTEGKLLVLFVAGLFERLIGKSPIVAMVMLNFLRRSWGQRTQRLIWRQWS
jgi:hypothetical protein